MTKKVIAYLHTHWDREWYREFEVFRLRLLRVFDNVLDMLEENKIPSFYFDGQVCAILDYLEIRPKREEQIRKFIKNKKLFIGPFYTLIDEFLTDKVAFCKNLEIGLKISKAFGCNDFIGYFADTFGHSKNLPSILKEFGIDKCIVWRGCNDTIPADFKFNGINTVNLIRGYFTDIFSAKIDINEKAKFLKDNLDKIAAKSREYLLLPIGADHLGIEPDITEQIQKINHIYKTDKNYNFCYEIELSNPFEYFKKVDFGGFEFNDELRDNSNTFILQGAYSARIKLKQYNVKCSYLLHQADKLQQKYGSNYTTVIEYAYKLLLKNLAHDGICGCSTDLVCKEIIVRYEKIIQIANTIIEELRLKYNFETPVTDSKEILAGFKVINKHFGVENSLLYDTQKIPVTEDFTDIYTQKKLSDKKSDIDFKVKNGKICMNDIEIEFVRFKDMGDAYNFGAKADDKGEKAKVYSFEKNIIKTDFFDVEVEINELVNFKIKWDNNLENTLWQVKFNLKNPVTETCSEDMNTLIYRKFDPYYDMRKHLPEKRGIEVKTNFAPMQRYVGTQNLGIITQGLTEYEVKGNSLLITILRSVGVISNPQNPSRSTPAGPPFEVPDAQQKGLNCVEFSAGFFEPKDYEKYINIVFPPYC